MSVTKARFPGPNGRRPLPSDGTAQSRQIDGADVVRIGVGAAILFVAGILLGAFTFRQLVGHGSVFFILAGIAAIVLTAVAYYRLELTLLLTVACAWLNIGRSPDVATGATSGTGQGLYPVDLIAVFLLFIWVLRGLGGKGFRFQRTPMDTPLIIYLAFSVWTAVNGYLFWDPAVERFYAGQPNNGHTPLLVVIADVGMRFVSVGIFWLMANNLTDTKWLKRTTWMLYLPGLLTCLALYHVIPKLGMGWPVLMETVLGCTLWGWLLEGRKTGPAKNRVWSIGAAVLLMAVIFATFFLNIQWLSGYIALLTGLFYVTLLRSRWLFVGLLIGILALGLGAKPFIQAKVVKKVETSGDLDRFSMARGSLLYASHFPLGVGPGNYRNYNQYYGSAAQWNTTTYTSCHDTYGQSLSEMGFGGFAVVLLWVISGLVMVTKIYIRLPPGFSRNAVLGIAGMWAGLATASCLGDYLVPVYYNGGLFNFATTIYGWIALGIAVAHSRNPIVDASTDVVAEKPVSVARPEPSRWARLR